MSFYKFEKDSYCVGGRHRSATTKIYGEITVVGVLADQVGWRTLHVLR